MPQRQLTMLPADMPVPVTPQLRLEPVTTSICLCWQAVRPIQKALAAGALHPSPKTAWQGVCFLPELPCQCADGTFVYSVGNCHIIKPCPSYHFTSETCHQFLPEVRPHLWCGVHSPCNQVTFSHWLDNENARS